MKGIGSTLVATLLAAGAAPAMPEGGCGQHFTFLGVSAGDPPIAWLTEDIGDACGFSMLIQVAVRPDTAYAHVTHMTGVTDWEWLSRGRLLMAPYVEPSPATGEVEPAETPAGVLAHRRPPDAAPVDRLPHVLAPEVSEAWHAEFLAHLEAGGSDAVTWNAERGTDGILPPTVDGVEAEVVYAYPHGLYVNYDVARVERLPHGHLMLLTLQPALGLYHNTMHGFLIVRDAGAAAATR